MTTTANPQLGTRYSVLGTLTLCLALTGCGSLSGLGGTDKFACKAPDGVTCTSVSGVYSNSIRGGLPAQTDQEQAMPQRTRQEAQSQKDERRPAAQYAREAFAPVGGPITPGDPLLAPPRVLRVWLAPWTDEDGDLHAESYIYVMWHRGEWKVQHTQRQIRDRFQAVKAPAQTGAKAETAKSDGRAFAREMAEAGQQETSGDR
jgi:conjugal transfer pilus assembly protein TraV